MEPLPPGTSAPAGCALPVEEPLPPGCEPASGCALPPPPPGPPPRGAYAAYGYYGQAPGSSQPSSYYGAPAARGVQQQQRQRYGGGPPYGRWPDDGGPFRSMQSHRERTIKRERATEAAFEVAQTTQGPIKRHRLLHPTTFVIAGGSSGEGFCYELKEALSRLGHATEVAKWNGHYEAHMNANVATLEKCANDAAKVSEDASVLLVGCSFGCRVVAECLARRGDAKRAAKAKALHPNVIVDGAVFVSYPLYGPAAPRDAKGDRALVLAKLPERSKLLFVSGEKDEFLDRTSGGTAWRKEHMPRGVAALRAVAADLPCAEGITVVGIENTGHAALKAGRKKVEPAKELMLRAMEPFIEAFHGIDLAIDTKLSAQPDDDDDDDQGPKFPRSHVRNSELPAKDRTKL